MTLIRKAKTYISSGSPLDIAVKPLTFRVTAQGPVVQNFVRFTSDTFRPNLHKQMFACVQFQEFVND